MTDHEDIEVQTQEPKNSEPFSPEGNDLADTEQITPNEATVKDEQNALESNSGTTIGASDYSGQIATRTEKKDNNAKPIFFLQNSSSSPPSTSKRRRKEKEVLIKPESHRVTFTVTISKAIPTIEEEELVESYDPRRRRRILEAPRAQNHFHVEYSLLPGDEEVIKTDIVTFGVAAKIYTEKQDAKVLKTWNDGDLTWVAWTHAHTLNITDEFLTKLFTHELQLRVWDSKDKLSARARYDRPKAFKLPSSKPGEDADGGGVKSLVMAQVESYQAMQPNCSIGRALPVIRNLPKLLEAMPDNDHPELLERVTHKKSAASLRKSQRPLSPTPDTLVQVPVNPANNDKTYNRLGELAGVMPPTEKQSKHSSRAKSQPSRGKTEAKSSRRNSKSSPLALSPRNKTAESKMTETAPFPDNIERKGSADSQLKAPGEPQKPRRSRRSEAAALAQAELLRKHGIACIPIQIAKLFAGLSKVTERLEKAVNGIQDMFITVSLSGPLMSITQHHKLNPLVVKVTCGSDMPPTPLSYDELRLQCEPSYIKYKMFDMPEHRSVGREQNKDIYWNDIHVVLAGTLDPSKLREHLQGPPIEIEVHDRDKIREKPKDKPTLFGDDLEDEKISNVGTICSKRTTNNPFYSKDKAWDPYGVAKLDLSGLLLGQKIIHMKLPIHQCPIPDILGTRDITPDSKLIGIAGAVDGPEVTPFPPGHFIQNGSYLKVKIEVAYPLSTPSQIAVNQEVGATLHCPFGRIVYKFDYKNITFLNKLHSLIIDINAKALGLKGMAPHIIKAALSTYKLAPEQQSCNELDIITGFHVLDGNMHVLILEGLLLGGVTDLWKTLSQPENSDVRVLFHSDLFFSERLYGRLDVDIYKIKLHMTLVEITSQPLLYVRDMVPKPCFQAVTKLDEISRTPKLRDAVRNDLFPTVEMVVSMSKEFGIPLKPEEFQELKADQETVRQLENFEKDNDRRTSRVWTPIDNCNTDYMEKIHERRHTLLDADFIEANKTMVRERSMMNSVERSQTMPLTLKVHSQQAFNYSTQALNSTEQAKETLRNMLAQKPDERYTYCAEYHNSMTVVPVNVDKVKKAQEKAAKEKQKTADGFVYPGKKTMIDSNVHSRKPHYTRIEALQEPWEELSRLPRGTIIPRSMYKWNTRHTDLDIWTKPPPVFGTDDPITIHLAGEKLKQEKMEAKFAEHSHWKSKVVVDNTRPYFHRCATDTELRDYGFHSSNQIAKLQGLCKDPPMKYSLAKPGLTLNEIPPLNVVLNPSVDTDARGKGLDISPAIRNEFDQKINGFVPGNNNLASIKVDTNRIPTRDYNHGLFVQQKGQDFNVYHRERSFVHKRHIEGMTEKEYCMHIFRLPKHYDTLPKYFTLPELDNLKNIVSEKAA